MIGAAPSRPDCLFHGVRTNPLPTGRGFRRETTACHPLLRGSRSIRMIFTLAAIAARFPRRAGPLIGAVAALALAFQIGNASAAGPEVANFTLPNGLDVVVIPDHRTPVVTHMIWYKVGSADETPGKSGLAHFLEHLMFKGTAKNPAGRFSQTLATIGGQENAFTTADYTAYFPRIAKEYLPLGMEFEADRMTGLVLTDENVLPERDVVLEEFNMADARVAQPSLQRSYLVPSTSTAKPGESEALEILAQALGAGETSRLYRALVVEQRIATGAGGWYQGTALDETRFGVFASPLPGVTFATVEAAIDAVIAVIAERGITTAEFERAKTRLIADAVYAADNQATMARWYGAAVTSGSSVEKVTSWPERLRAVTPEAVQNAARMWLDKRRSVTGYLVKELPGNQEKRS